MFLSDDREEILGQFFGSDQLTLVGTADIV